MLTVQVNFIKDPLPNGFEIKEVWIDEYDK